MKTLLFASLLMFCGSVHGTVFGSGPVRKFYCFSCVSSTGNISVPTPNLCCQLRGNFVGIGHVTRV